MSCNQQTRKITPGAKNGGCGKPVLTDPGNQSLPELMSQWETENRPGFHEYLDGYRSSSFPEALKAASRGECPPNGKDVGKRHFHQRRIPKTAIKQWASKLDKAQAQIQSFLGLSFEDLFDFLDERARTIDGIGPLMVYDTALRIGANIGCLPKDWVYLHAHARISGVRSDVQRIRKSEFPKTLKALEAWEAYEIEDFLCVYQKQIKELMPRA